MNIDLLVFFSRYVTKSFIVPSIIKFGENYFIERMLDIGKKISKKKKTFLFTCSDDYLIVISNNWNKLSKYFISVSETNKDKLLNSLYKDRMYKVAKAANIYYPKTYYSNNINLDNLRYPVVIKPTIRKTSKDDIGKLIFKIKVCYNRLELVNAINSLNLAKSNFVVQDFIPGNDNQLFTVGLYSYKGDVVACASARKLRQFPPLIGECSFGELVFEPSVIDEAKKYIQKSGISGICQLEFKKYQEKYYLMEINPRPWSWNSIIVYSGINLPYIACKKILNPQKKIY